VSAAVSTSARQLAPQVHQIKLIASEKKCKWVWQEIEPAVAANAADRRLQIANRKKVLEVMWKGLKCCTYVER